MRDPKGVRQTLTCFIFHLCFLSFKIEEINNERDHNEQQIQNLQKSVSICKYNPLQNSGSIFFDNANDIDLH